MSFSTNVKQGSRFSFVTTTPPKLKASDRSLFFWGKGRRRRTITTTKNKCPSPLSSSSSLLHISDPDLSSIEEFYKWSDSEVEKRVDERRRAEKILEEIDSGKRTMPDWYWEDYGDEEKESDILGSNTIDLDNWGSWDERDLEGPRMEGDWDPKTDPDPNALDTTTYEYVSQIPLDEDGVELGYDPVLGSSYPIDERTIVNPMDSYMIEESTRNESMLEPDFADPNDIEISFNDDIRSFRKSLNIIDTFVDQFTGLEHPRHAARWHGYPEVVSFPPKPFENNRFTDPAHKTDFTKLTPYQARLKAIELARSKNNEWLPVGKSYEYHHKRTKIYAERGLLVGSLMEGEKDPDIVQRIQPVLDVLGSIADLLSIERAGDKGDKNAPKTIFRFHYHGLIKNRRGMATWTETMISDCGVDVTNVIFETGERKRDPWYDGGDHWYGPY